MFYVSGKRIFLADYDEEKHMYPEVVLKKTTDGDFYLLRNGKGSVSKPKDRRVCVMSEIIAQFGAEAHENEPCATAIETPVEEVPVKEAKVTK